MIYFFLARYEAWGIRFSQKTQQFIKFFTHTPCNVTYFKLDSTFFFLFFFFCQYRQFFDFLLENMVVSWNWYRQVLSKDEEDSARFLSWFFSRSLHKLVSSQLTHFSPMFPFYTLWKHQQSKRFLVFSGCMK